MPGSTYGGKSLLTMLGAGVAALLVLNLYLFQAPIDTSPIPPGTSKADRPNDGPSDLATPLDKKPVARFVEIVSRPLFTPDRKPVQRDRSQSSDTIAGTGDMRLVGVIKVDRQPARALIRLSSQSTGKWISEGEEFDGWKLRQVRERSVIVESGGRTHELELQAARRQTDDPAPGVSQPR
jgi:hypothetical protein